MAYSHTQQVPLVALAGTGVVIWLTTRGIKNFFGRMLATGALGLVAEMMRSLSVEVDSEKVCVTFGAGLFSKKIQLDDIESCRQWRISPLVGWGIHWIGSGWVYNIYGLDVVELKLKNGTIAMIGTDEPTELEQAIRDQLLTRVP